MKGQARYVFKHEQSGGGNGKIAGFFVDAKIQDEACDSYYLAGSIKQGTATAANRDGSGELDD